MPARTRGLMRTCKTSGGDPVGLTTISARWRAIPTTFAAARPVKMKCPVTVRTVVVSKPEPNRNSTVFMPPGAIVTGAGAMTPGPRLLDDVTTIAASVLL